MNYANQRPGVYSSYSVTARYAAPRARQHAALILTVPGKTAGLLQFDSMAEAVAGLTATEQLAARTAVRLLLESGVTRCYLSCVGDGGYRAATAAIEDTPDIGIVVSDASAPEDCDALRASVIRSSDALRERLLFLGSDADNAVATANRLNHERVICCTPAATAPGDEMPRTLYTAAAFAGAVLAQSDPAASLTALPLETLQTVQTLPEEQIQQLIAGGVSVFEGASAVECIRAVTSRTEPDLSLRPLNAILIIDDVMRSLRAGMKSLLVGGRGMTSYDSVAAQITILLASKQEEGILLSFGAPTVRVDSSDPSVCIAEISFRIAHVVEQIHLSAHIIL